MGKQSEVQAFAELATPKCQQNLGRVDICGIMVICQPSPYLIRNGQT